MTANDITSIGQPIDLSGAPPDRIVPQIGVRDTDHAIAVEGAP